MTPRKLMLCLVCAVALLEMGCSDGWTAKQKQADVEWKRLEGHWKVIKLQEGRVTLDPDDELVKNSKVTIRQGHVEIHNILGKSIRNITLDPTKRPKWIDIDGKKSSRDTHGIYKLNGDVLTLCFGRLGGERPSRFEAPEKGSLAVLKRK